MFYVLVYVFGYTLGNGGHLQCCLAAVSHCSFANCDNNSTNGCEVNIMSNANNCGGCGKVAALPNANATCSGGQAAFNGCKTG
jgi:hypothetical protein